MGGGAVAILKPVEFDPNSTNKTIIDYLRILCQNNYIVITGNQIIEAKLYSLSGCVIAYSQSTDNGTICKLPTIGLHGIYMLKINYASHSKTQKILVK